ncbi:MAG: hypothetical protein EOO24_05890 [Comamonadaceae bacterium]|nr:MAG: hypothetical protein EOO24_05890 [Comamonadaceae bacterium]
MRSTSALHGAVKGRCALLLATAALLAGCGSTPEPAPPSASSTPRSAGPATGARPSAPAAGAGARRPGAPGIRLMRPAAGPVLDAFNGKGNKGIDIGGKAGDPVWAAADGQVVYVGSQLRGYGNMIIVKHNDTFLTAYAHNRAVLVGENATVRRGQKIAEMGSTGTNRVKLHFEVRRDGNAVDPVPFLESGSAR